MSQKSFGLPVLVPAEKLVRDIRLATRKHHSSEDKIRIILVGLSGHSNIENKQNYDSESFALSVPFPPPVSLCFARLSCFSLWLAQPVQ